MPMQPVVVRDDLGRPVVELRRLARVADIAALDIPQGEPGLDIARAVVSAMRMLHRPALDRAIRFHGGGFGPEVRDEVAEIIVAYLDAILDQKP